VLLVNGLATKAAWLAAAAAVAIGLTTPAIQPPLAVPHPPTLVGTVPNPAADLAQLSQPQPTFTVQPAGRAPVTVPVAPQALVTLRVSVPLSRLRTPTTPWHAQVWVDPQTGQARRLVITP